MYRGGNYQYNAGAAASQRSPAYNYGGQSYSPGYSNNNNGWNRSAVSNNNSRQQVSQTSWQETSQRPVQRQAPRQQVQQQDRVPLRRTGAQSISRAAPTKSNWQTQVAVDEDSEYESDFQGSGIRPATSSQIRSVPMSNSLASKPFKSSETALCLVPQTPSIMEITRLLKGEKGDTGRDGDSFFELSPEDSTTVKLNRGVHLNIPGTLTVSQMEVVSGPRILAGGEGTTGEDGRLTIQLPRELKGQWNEHNTKVSITPRQACSGLYLPENAFEADRNQFTVVSNEKQRVTFDWFMVRL